MKRRIMMISTKKYTKDYSRFRGKQSNIHKIETTFWNKNKTMFAWESEEFRFDKMMLQKLGFLFWKTKHVAEYRRESKITTVGEALQRKIKSVSMLHKSQE